MMRIACTVGMAAALLIGGCATAAPNDLEDGMRRVMRTQPMADGLFLVGLEKAAAKSVGRLPQDGDKGGCVGERCLQLERLGAKVAKDHRTRLNDPRPIFLSHVVRLRGTSESPDIEPCRLIYSTYDATRCGTGQALTLRGGPYVDAGWTALEEALYRALDAEVKARKVSHLVLMSTGWKELQLRSLDHYAAWSEGLNRELGPTGAWRPLYVGLSWPAGWGGEDPNEVVKNISLANKMNDADELGVGWGSILLNRTIARLKAEHPELRVVLIGHSFGARLLSQASYSWPAVKPSCGATAPDLLIGLQAAFSSARFIRGGGAEGSPYADFATCGPMPAFTSSEQDSAMKVAIFQQWADAKYLGKPQSDTMLERYRDTFTQVVLDKTGLPTGPLPPRGKVLLLRGNEAICGHTDVHDAAVARMMAKLVLNYAWSGPAPATVPAAVWPDDLRDTCAHPGVVE